MNNNVVKLRGEVSGYGVVLNTSWHASLVAAMLGRDGYKSTPRIMWVRIRDIELEFNEPQDPNVRENFRRLQTQWNRVFAKTEYFHEKCDHFAMDQDLVLLKQFEGKK